MCIYICIYIYLLNHVITHIKRNWSIANRNDAHTYIYTYIYIHIHCVIVIVQNQNNYPGMPAMEIVTCGPQDHKFHESTVIDSLEDTPATNRWSRIKRFAASLTGPINLPYYSLDISFSVCRDGLSRGFPLGIISFSRGSYPMYMVVSFKQTVINIRNLSCSSHGPWATHPTTSILFPCVGIIWSKTSIQPHNTMMQIAGDYIIPCFTMDLNPYFTLRVWLCYQWPFY